ncbi:MAG: right-handed parallel beta-helix repeat-containing protein [Phycisphaerae bacterium]|nr:right-handed parallel beta-helix repeat-containing protein [Phycisphaerae bacterium]
MKRKHVFGMLVGLMSASAFVFGADGGVIVVAPGTAIAALDAGIEAAQKVGAKLIEIEPGEYFVEQTISLDSKDNGLTIHSQEAGKAILNGGKKITGWQKDGENFYSATLPEVKEGKWDFRMLVVNGRMASRSRWPKTGRLTHESRFDVPWMSTTGGGWQRKPTHEELTTMKFKAADIGAGFEPKNAEITVYHMWDESMVGVASIDRATSMITFSSEMGHPAGAFGVNEYVVWNVREGMNEPGQWYLDRAAGKVVYWPLAGEDMSKATVYAPTVETIVKVNGAKDVTIRGLAFSVTNTPLKAGGFGAGNFDGAVQVNKAGGCKLVGLEVFNVAGQGIKVSGGGTTIDVCHIHDIGACGIQGERIRIVNSHIHHIGRMYPSAIAVSSGGSSLISHNEVHDCPYSAIICGGAGGVVEYNRISQAMLELHDGGAIYMFAGKGSVMRGNFAFDIPDTGGYGSSAYYLDEQSEDCVVEKNVSIGIARPSHNHMAKRNTIRNNVFVYDGDMTITFPRCGEYVFEKNILVAKGLILFQGINNVSMLSGNVLFSGSGKRVGETLKDYGGTGRTDIAMGENNKAVDPKISVESSGKVVYGDSAILETLKIEKIDGSTAGTKSRF